MGFTAIFGGTFNPPHIGHYQMISALEQSSQIDKILVTPTKIPPHKVCDYLATDLDRISMCKLMIKNFKKSELCLKEFEREGKSYSYETVIQMKREYPYTDFAFVLGGDMLMSFDRWYRYDDLIKLVPFFVFRRSDCDEILFKSKINELRNKGMIIYLSDKIIPSVSSTYIRNNLKTACEQMPQEVYKYIVSRRLYNE